MSGLIGKIPSRSKIVNEPLTDGGVLLGSGVDAITATAALADGEMLVGDGTTDPAIESGATLRTSIGLGNVNNVADASQTSLGTVTSGTISTGAVIDDPTMTQGSDATGDVYYRAASGKLTRLATGADGTVLTSTGAGAVPAFEALPAAAKILQVLQTVKTDTTSTTSTSFEDMTGMSVAITPSAATSKVYILCDINIGNATAGYFTHIRIQNDTTGAAIYIADAHSVRCSALTRNANNQEISNVGPKYLDSPSTTSAVTYRVQWRVEGQTGYLNRNSADTADTSYGRTASSITVMEVGA